jgi:hypothetical protein
VAVEVKKAASTPYRSASDPHPSLMSINRPPGSTGALSEMMKREKDGPKVKVGAVSAAPVAVAAPAPKPRRIPGMPPPPEPVVKAASSKSIALFC